ncbi:MAG: helix-turn-helix transcriptional regulator, partial [Clostridia bacterium]|nr:helix-turn-helix transcriptional regulator [Clostridia bacterium]
MRLKELRRKRKISQVKLAIDLCMTQNSISRYENGTREADYKTLIQFADYFDV